MMTKLKDGTMADLIYLRKGTDWKFRLCSMINHKPGYPLERWFCEGCFNRQLVARHMLHDVEKTAMKGTCAYCKRTVIYKRRRGPSPNKTSPWYLRLMAVTINIETRKPQELLHKLKNFLTPFGAYEISYKKTRQEEKG
jgi:hypothetical protein